jgi:predicted amidohydrolase
VPETSSTTKPDLRFTLIQPEVAWEEPLSNRAHYEALIREEASRERLEIVLLPEMFATGFSMNTAAFAEDMDGPIVSWMKEIAQRHRCILGGSAMIREADGQCFNRFLWVLPNGVVYHYDKRHLFAYGSENQHYTPGNRRVIVQVRGWRICLQVCYDLRFPVWSRNVSAGPQQGGETQSSDATGEYDVLVYIASWPERRAAAWNTLLPARAIENQAYCIGLNRVGADGNGVNHRGDSGVYHPDGSPVWKAPEGPAVHTLTLSWEPLQSFREHFPFLKDADPFMLL